VRAVATINDVESHCCVVLLKLPAKTPQLFCAAPSRSRSYSRLPAAGVSVELRPSCTSTTPGATGGSLACTGEHASAMRHDGTHACGLPREASCLHALTSIISSPQ
jgi:hypothetical protein